MPSYARKHQLTQSLIYHIYNRSNARTVIFHDKKDFEHFRDLLIHYKETFQFLLYHWVIMSNHYHLLLEMETPEKISKLMAGLGRSYTHHYHKKYKSHGYLWQGRFKMQPIQKENYLLACGRYIERNPLRAGLVSEADQYSFSSALYHCQGKDDGLTDENPSFPGFGDTLEERQQKYKQFLKDFDTEEEQFFRRFEEPLGHEEFKRRLINFTGRYLPRRRGRKQERIVL